MRPISMQINITVDGCSDHTAGRPTEEIHEYASAALAQADALLFGRVTYQLMESAFRIDDPDELAASADPFVKTINAAKKYVVSNTLTDVDWNAELLTGDLETSVRALKSEPGTGIFVGGTQLMLALAELNLIDNYEFVIHPRIAGHGPTPFAGLSKFVDLEFVGQTTLNSGAVALRYRPESASA